MPIIEADTYAAIQQVIVAGSTPLIDVVADFFPRYVKNLSTPAGTLRVQCYDLDTFDADRFLQKT